jgi:hypothetical protein
MTQERLLPKHIHLRLALLTNDFTLHLTIASRLLQTILYTTQKDEIELANILLIPHGNLIAIIIDNGRQHQRRIQIPPIGRNQSTEQLFQILNQPTTDHLPFKIKILLYAFLYLLIFDPTVTRRHLIGQDGPHESGVLEICLQEGIEVAG